jgi:hypothetical protein
MKTILNILLTIFVLQGMVVNGQKNYIIEYDKLNDNVQYFESEWLEGESRTKKVDEIVVAHNDLVTVRVINVNELAFDTEVVQAFTEEKEFSNPFSILLATFGKGLPGLSLLGNLGQEAPSNIGGRNESEEVKNYKGNLYEILAELHRDLRDATQAYNAFEQAESVIYSKTMTKDQIRDALTLALEKIETTNISSIISNIQKNEKKLDELLEEDILDYDDKAWDDIDNIDDVLSDFEEQHIDEYGDVKSISPSQTLSKLASKDFEVEHTYRSKTHEGTWKKYDMNDYFILFRDKKEGEEESDDLLVDHAKMVSVKTKKKYKPHWGLGVDYVLPFSGRTEYVVSSAQSIDWDMPDSLSVSENSTSAMQLTIGTKLCFDIPTKNSLMPSGVFGIAIGGLSNVEENFNLNFLLGGGLGFKGFPYLSLNAGISFSQLNVLKDGYRLNSSFIEPEGYDSTDQSSLFDKKFKPGIFFGLTVRL